MRKFGLLGSSALRSVALIGVALSVCSPSLAQETPAEEEAGTTQDDPVASSGDVATVPTPPNESATGDETIVVTGSRIRGNNEFTSPDPVALIDPAMAQREGRLDTASMLQSSPIAAGSTQITSAISANFVTAGGPGAQTLDLRGLGPNRTLVLLNGRRAGPAGTRGAVSSFDLNVLPQSIVERVDILKTGASSIYGSDAVAGVVNLITKTKMDGLELNGNVSVPFDSGGEQYRLSALAGKTFGRGHIMVAADYFKQNELARGDRRYLDCPEAYTFRRDGSRADLIDPRTGAFKCEDLRWGHVWTYDVEYILEYGEGNLALPNGRPLRSPVLMQFQYPGENLGLQPVRSPAGALTEFRAPPGWFPTGYDAASLAVQNSFHPFVLEQTLIPRTERMTAYADAAFELSDDIEAFGEFLFNRRKTYQNGWRQFWNFGITGNYYGFAADPAAAGWEGWNWLSATGITNHADNSQQVDYYRGVGGLRGGFGSGFLKDWSWDGHVQYSRSDGRYRSEQILDDAVYELSYFQTSTCANTSGPWGPVTPISGKQCLDLPWYDPYFLAGEFTPQQVNYMFEWEEGRTKYTQLGGEFSVTGPLFELPGGPLAVAFGVAARRDQIRDVPGHLTMTENPFFDPTLNPNSATCRSSTARNRTLPCRQFVSNAWGATSSGITAGKSTTTEAFGEVQIPLFRDRPFFHHLGFSAAGRVTNVKSVQAVTGATDEDTGNWTYKLGANWAVTPWLRFRATYGTSFRAPALFEQFLADELSFARQTDIDPCVNWQQELALGNITQRIATNCAAAGVPGNHAGAGITAEVAARGGIGELNPETSTAKTASIILTPTFSFLPNTRVSVAVDYFDIEVKGEVTKLGPANILFGCFSSADYPNDPLCSLFSRGQVITAPNNISTVQDKYINIASQRNSGIDVTGNIRQDLGDLGTLNFLASMTWQLKDDFEIFEGIVQSDNGEAGSPKFVGDFNLTWRTRDGWSLFYGLDVFSGTSDEADFIEENGDLCVNSAIRGEYCVDVTTPTTMYHHASITKELPNNFEITLGVSNIFDKRPPRVSVLNGGEIDMIGPVVATSQYDFLGRRAFVNVTTRF
jgi:iron complex outermembrane receptor protein